MSRTVSLDELLALNQEILAISRIGVPLEPGLRDFARQSPGHVGKVAAQMSERLASGKSLMEAAHEVEGLPPLYAAVLEAGMRSGRLSAALEALADSARRLADLRRSTNLALAYPVFVLFLLYNLLLFFLLKIAPSLALSLDDVSSRTVAFFGKLTRVGLWLEPWAWAPPLALVLFLAVWWGQASRSQVIEPHIALRWLGWIPWFGSLRRYSQQAAFAESLALLLEHGRPLPESLELAAQATGGSRLTRGAFRASQAIRQGSSPAQELRRCGLPPLICWLLGAPSATDLPAALRLLGKDYHQRAAYQAEKIELFLPVVLTGGIAGVAVALYALILFLPWTTALQELAAP